MALVKRPVGVALAGIVLLAVIVRFWGIGYGLPHPLARPDEEIVVGHALELSVGGVENRETFPYPELMYFVDPVRGRQIRPDVAWAYPYPNLVYGMDALALAAWRAGGQAIGTWSSRTDFIDALVSRDAGEQYRVARTVTALCGVATVLAVFAAAMLGYRRRSVALLAALMVAVNFLHARDSHYATVDVPMTLFATIAIAFAMRAGRTASRRDAVLSALFGGLAASAKFNGAAVLASTVVGAARRFFGPASARRRRRILATLAIAGLVSIVVFAATSPYCIRDYRLVHLGLRVQQRVLFSGEGPAAWWVFLRSTLPGAFGWPGFVVVLIGVARAVWLRRNADIVLLAFVVPLFASMAAMTWILPRYPLPLVPALAVLAADAGVALAGRLRWPGMTILALALAVPPLASIVAYDRLASQPDTRLLATAWTAAHVPAGSRVAVCRGYGAPMVNVDQRKPQTFDEVRIPCALADILGSGARYVITHTHPWVPFFRPTDDVLRWLEANGRSLASFSPWRTATDMSACFYPGDAFYIPYCDFGAVERGGPAITVWELPGAKRADSN